MCCNVKGLINFVYYNKKGVIMFIELLLLAVIIIAISMVGMGISMLVKKGGRFPETSVGKNKELSKMGIKCASHEEILVRRQIDGRGSCSGGCGCH